MAGKIQDFGEKIGGANKDQWKDRGLSKADVQAMTEAERLLYITKNEIWPRVDYKKLYAAGADKRVLYCIKKVRDAVPTSPKAMFGCVSEKTENFYIELLTELRGGMDPAESYENIQKFAGRILRTYPLTSRLRNALLLCRTPYKVKNGMTESGFLKEEDKTEKGKTGGRKEPAGTRKVRYRPPRLKTIERIGGDDVRGGRDVTGEELDEVYSFRGGEFGNWLPDAERQESLNFTFDSLHDLACALRILDKEIGLDGGLAIAFGSRGRGNEYAHYESARKVISLCRFGGAGSLAHEMIHAIDNYACIKILGREGMYSDENTGGSIAALMKVIRERELSHEETIAHLRAEQKEMLGRLEQDLAYVSRRHADPVLEARSRAYIQAVLEETVNPALLSYYEQAGKYDMSPAYAAFVAFQKEHGDRNPGHGKNRHYFNVKRRRITELAAKLVRPDQIDNIYGDSHFMADARELDQLYTRQGHGYWSSDCELLARAGAVYVKDRLAEQGIRNDYLCGHADVPGISYEDHTIYISPQGEERETINTAFDAFFEDLFSR